MKILKYVIGILAILALIFLLLGVMKSEITYGYDIIVDKPLAESWAVSQDEEKMADWLPGFQKIEHVSGTPNTVGAVSDVHFINQGKEVVIRETITEIIPDESISMTFTDNFMTMDYTLNMADENGKTKISTNTTATGNGMFSRSIMALMGGMIKGQEETNLANLKRVIEENNKNYFPKVEEVMEVSE